MKFLKLHSKTITVNYRNSLCSNAFLLVFFATITSVLIPVLLVTILSPYSGVSEVRTLYEQPKLIYQYKFILLAASDIADDNKFIACSSFSYFNRKADNLKTCHRIMFTAYDYNNDGKMDKANFQIFLNGDEEIASKTNLYLVLLFQGFLKHKCPLEPPAVLIHELQIPNMSSGKLEIKGYLKLVQNHQFMCPYYGQRTSTTFQTNILPDNSTDAELFQIRSIRERIKLNPGYFDFIPTETYFTKSHETGFKISMSMNIVEVNTRYHLSIWERLGQFWLYFASFFGFSFYISNKFKDFLFSRHILTSWEVIPWNKPN